jgi:hypothetical protein
MLVRLFYVKVLMFSKQVDYNQENLIKPQHI